MHAENDPSHASRQIPRLAPGADPTCLRLTPEQGYLLSRVDGCTPWDLLREIGGLPSHEADRCLQQWLDQGILTLDHPGKTLSSPQPSPAGAGPAATAPGIELDPTLDIPAEIQRRALELARRLDRPYHEILGVPRDADARALKRAYFALSKQFHPDRYFRRAIGPFADLLERLFRKIVEAYELLSDPTARAEVERSFTASRPTAEADSKPRAASPGARFRPGHYVFSMHARARRDRQRKAKTLFESGMTSFAEECWLEAAAGVRLAIAFDPWNEAYKDAFAKVQRRAHEERARQLVREADSALDLRDLKGALGLLEEALYYRPHDAELSHRAAKLAWLAASDLKRAKEYAAQACELAPEVAEYHRTLGQIYKEAGLEANARRELEQALHLDPEDAEARVELRALGRRLKLPLSLGGRR